MSARGFVWRWSWRQVRREWRQYFVILAMLICGVAVAVASVLMVHNMVAPPTSEYGNGQIAVDIGDRNDELDAALDANGIDFGVVRDAVVERPGQAGQIALRAADPSNATTDPLFALVDGRWPTTSDEVAVTDRVLADRLPVGAPLSIGGRTVEIVGVVENPTRLSDEFVFAVDTGSFETTSESTRYLVDATIDQLLRVAPANTDIGVSETSGPSDRAALTILVNVIVAFGMLEVALLVGSAFAVILRRRTRQYGLLASAGATPRMVRRSAMSTGAIVGALGTGAGFLVGATVALLLVPAMEGSVDHRISFEFPFLSLLPSVVLGVAVPAITARRPAARMNRSSVASLLSSARPQPEPVGASAIVGVVVAALGTTMLILGFSNLNASMAVAGTVLAPVGFLLLSPLLVKLLGVVATRLPLAERLGGRSVARYNRRSASLVAALALALAVPVGIAVASTSVDQRTQNRPPNLAQHQLVVWAPDVSLDRSVVPASVDELALTRATDSLTTALPNLSFTPLQVIIERPDDGFNEEGIRWTFPLVAGEPFTGDCNFCDMDITGNGDAEFVVGLAFVGTPDLLEVLDLETDWVGDGRAALARNTEMSLLNGGDLLATGDEVAVSASWPEIGSFPDLVISPTHASGAQVTTVGWLATSAAPISDESLQTIAEINLGAVDLELPTPPQPKTTLRALGLLIGALIGMAITASAVLLLSTELARESAVLASLGASPRTGRRMSAAIAGLLAITGALLGLLIGYLPLGPMMSSERDEFPFVIPWISLLSLVVIFPVAAAGLGWVLSRRSAGGLNLRDFV